MGYAITTRYAGPTDHRGSRIIGTGPALHSGERVTRATVPYDYGESGSNVHRPAAEAVVDILRADGWSVTLSGDHFTLPDESAIAWPLAYGTDR